MAFTLPDLPYAKDALEPVIDARTMEIHHDKHHNGYCTKLNAAIEGTDLEGRSVEEIVGDLSKAPAQKRTAIRNNGGGFLNHNLFWPLMAPPGSGGKPEGQLAAAIDSDLGGYDKFKEAFAAAATSRFGSGWAWVIVQNGKLVITSTKNQDSPLMHGLADFEGESGNPILGLDVWEHAYYLKYQNRRPDYVQAFFDVINWEQVARNHAAAK